MRSEAMQLVQVIIPAESAHLTVSYLGDLGLIQFKDVRPPAPCSSLRLRCSGLWYLEVLFIEGVGDLVGARAESPRFDLRWWLGDSTLRSGFPGN
jgi:hypothetical protein